MVTSFRESLPLTVASGRARRISPIALGHWVCG
jgi:hypothetical protein